VDTMKGDLKQIGCEVMNQIQLSLNRFQWPGFVNTVVNIQVPRAHRVANLLTSWTTISFARRTLLHGVSYTGTHLEWPKITRNTSVRGEGVLPGILISTF
jgi:hypothetical protein